MMFSERLFIINQLQKLVLFIAVNQLKKADYDTKIGKKIKFLIRLNITTPEFDKSTKENLNERLKHSDLASKNDIDDFIKKTDCDDKPRNVNSKNTSNKEKHVEIDKKTQRSNNFLHKISK